VKEKRDVYFVVGMYSETYRASLLSRDVIDRIEDGYHFKPYSGIICFAEKMRSRSIPFYE
jgi:hypothetical protein